mmetsp:Transcript_9395/g.17986  ORF Transcript_9395/g.17986 Transcript_9395/m.17986 type:complete len:106 (-) Transcript_9395:133-450(-)
MGSWQKMFLYRCGIPPLCLRCCAKQMLHQIRRGNVKGEWSLPKKLQTKNDIVKGEWSLPKKAQTKNDICKMLRVSNSRASDSNYSAAEAGTVAVARISSDINSGR